MNSGLEWEENYNLRCDQNALSIKDMSRAQWRKPAVFKPDTHWNYSSGTTNFGIFTSTIQTHQEYLDFWYSA
jgi:hypothetical protein